MKKNILFTALMLITGALSLVSLVGWMNKTPDPTSTAAISGAAVKSLRLLEKSGYAFTNNSEAHCASCHHNTLLAMTADIARQKDIPVVDSFTQQRIASMEGTVMFVCNPNLVNNFVPANFIPSYVLLGLYAEKYKGNMYTDIAVNYLISQAKPDGSFLTESGRVPMETGTIHLAAMSARAIQLYAAPALKKQADELATKTKLWMEKETPSQQQEIVFQLLGLQWSGSNKEIKTKVAARLVALQQPDGGWAQMPTMKTDAYATGQALYALFESGMAKPEDAVYQRGLEYLLKTQDKDGAWVVQTRSYPIQKFVNTDFPPYDDNQYISAAASNWATMALLNALPDKTK